MAKPTITKVPRDKSKKSITITAIVLSSILLFIGCFALFAALWYTSVYGDTGFDSIIYTLFSDLGGVDMGLVTDFILWALVPAIIVTAVIVVLLYLPLKNRFFITTKKGKSFNLYPFSKLVSAIVSIVLAFAMLIYAATSVKLFHYVSYLMQDTKVFMESYADPVTTKIDFPEEKRNVIIIYLESMETTFMSEANGGGVKDDLTPQLYDLAMENVNFSHTSGYGGGVALTGGKWTIGALVSHTSGIPLKTPSGNQNDYKKNFLPGVYSLSNILHDNGYYQAFMCGSDANFGGRYAYYTEHGTDAIYDLISARKEGYLPSSDYHDGWWGFQDHYLFKYAKDKLTEISQQEKPFAFSMLTVDTHFANGHPCSLCGGKYDEQYDNVWACSSKQVAEFVDWIKEQEFFENTTVVLTGDHLTMDDSYIQRVMNEGYDRRVYNCFINSAAQAENVKNRQFSTIDMFPTVLAAMGCKIEGERLGLGTNLFSSKPTLCEELGIAEFDIELQKSASTYDNFYLPRDQWPEPETEEVLVKEETDTSWIIPAIIAVFAVMLGGVIVAAVIIKRKRA